ncbi:DUF4270 family protein [Rapidithrix thailandica]|uniref:DUF4270 family protein n=1 Tax=Rapidithrix thailandica TaxID=413964 RepID=A0AAW9SIV8_9BACT
MNILNHITNYTMNLRAKTLGLGLLSILAFLSLGCDNDTESIGLELRPDDLINTTFTDTFSIKTSIVKLDSVPTSNTGVMLVGSTKDPVLGHTQATTYFGFQIAGDKVELSGKDGERQFDKATLTLGYGFIYGDSNSTQTFVLHELADSIHSKTHYQFDEIESLGTELAKVEDFKVAGDTNKFVSFNLSEEYGNKLFEMVQDTLKPITRYNTHFLLGGIKVSSLSEEDDAIFGFRTISSSGVPYSYLTLHYHYFDDENKKVEKEYKLYISRPFHHIENDFSESAYLSGWDTKEPLSTEMTNNRCIIQAASGITTRLEFPTLNRNVEELLINKAEIVLQPIDDGNFNGQKLPPSGLRVIRLDANGNRKFFEDDKGNFISYDYIQNELVIKSGGQFTPMNIGYIANGRSYAPTEMTSYIQNLVWGKETGYGLLIEPTNNSSTINKLFFGDFQNMDDFRLQLRIHYSLLD